MIRKPLFMAAVIAAVSGAPPAAAQSTGYPLRLDSVRVVGRDQAFGSIMAGDVGSDGRVFVLDDFNFRVVAFSPEGRFLWSFGRKGGGPGEFQQPYRLDVDREGVIYVYDLGSNAITEISKEGRFVRRYAVPFRFYQVDNLAAFPGGTIVIAGTTRSETLAGRSALHRFVVRGPEMKYVGSFGPLPTAKDPEVALRWGAGFINQASGNDLLYLRRIPYELYRYNPTGAQRSVLRPPFRTRGTPDDAIRVQRAGNGLPPSFSPSDAVVDRPSTAWELSGGWVLVIRIEGDVRRWDVYGRDGRYAGTRTAPPEYQGILGFDASRGLLWAIGEQDDEPVLLRTKVSLGAR